MEETEQLDEKFILATEFMSNSVSLNSTLTAVLSEVTCGSDEFTFLTAI